MAAPPLPANLYFWQGLRWATGGLVVLGLPALFFLPGSEPFAGPASDSGGIRRSGSPSTQRWPPPSFWTASACPRSS